MRAQDLETWLHCPRQQEAQALAFSIVPSCVTCEYSVQLVQTLWTATVFLHPTYRTPKKKN